MRLAQCPLRRQPAGFCSSLVSYHTPHQCSRNGCGAESDCDDDGGDGDVAVGGEGGSENVSGDGGGVWNGEDGVRYHEMSVSYSVCIFLVFPGDSAQTVPQVKFYQFLRSFF